MAFQPNPKEYQTHLKLWERAGLLSKRWYLRGEKQSQLVVLTHERRWSAYPLLAARLRGLPEVCQVSLLDVPLGTVYKQ